MGKSKKDIKMLLSKPMYLVFALTLIVTGALMNIMQVVAYVFVKPFNKSLYRKMNYFCGYSMFSQAVFASRWWANTKFTMYADKAEYEKFYGREHSLCIMNHSCEIDWIVANSLLDTRQILGNEKAFIKSVVKYVPIIGWGFWFQEYIFLTRSFDKDREAIKSQVKELAEYEDPIWLLLFPEGTRFTKAKHEKALEFLKQRNMPELKHHLVPRTKGFTTSIPFLKEKFKAIYNVELVFHKDNNPNVNALLTGRQLEAHMYVKRIPIEDVPDTEEAQDKFLRDMFYEKDRLQDSYKRTGDFFKTSGVERLPAMTLERRFMPLINFVCWSMVSVLPMIYYLFKMLLNGDFFYLTICCGIIVACCLVLSSSLGTVEVKPDANVAGPRKDAKNVRNKTE